MQFNIPANDVYLRRAELNKTAKEPTSSDFRDGEDAEGEWYEVEDGQLVKVEQVAGSSGVYLVVSNVDTGAIIRDGRPWQMTV